VERASLATDLSVSHNGNDAIVPEGLPDFVPKGLKDSAWGFYEAELVKAALQKRIFLKVLPVCPRSGDKTPTTGSLVFDRHDARHEHRDDQIPKVSEAFSASATGLG
jgi:hypothetical protein